ncbi:MAG: helix-turn-helix domain-containing protein [Metallibacterium sp.]
MDGAVCEAIKICLLLQALSLNKPKIMSNFAIPPHVSERIVQLGQRIRIARIRRGWSVVDLASKAGVNRNTVTALELGKPGTAIGVCFTVLWALGLEKSLDAVADPDTDAHGKGLEASRRPMRAGRPRKAGNDYDF